MQSLPPALAPLASLRQFLCYALVPSQTKPGKMDKFPVSPFTGQVCSAHDPAHWTDAQTACTVAASWGPTYGVAFSLQRGNNLFFVDLDNHRTDAGWSPLAQQIAAMFPGAAMELSQSGRGMHIIGCGTPPVHSCKRADLGLELYTEARFIALTGRDALGSVATDHTAALHALAGHYFPPGAGKHEGAFTLTTEPVAEWRGPADDEELLRRALQSRSAASVFGPRASFADLWEGNAEVLRAAYPSPDKVYDGSSADAALAAHLAFWTGKHGERMERLMRRSALVRDKWNRSGDDYLARTICEVIARGGDVLQDKPPEPPQGVPAAVAEAPAQRAVEGQTYLNADAQRDLFRGCVYVRDQHRVLVPGGHLLKPEQFRVQFGGYVFPMDDVNQRTSRDAWEAFTQSQILRAPVADSVCFRPQDPPATLYRDAGRVLANTYWKPEVARAQGDASPFFDLLRRLLPDERDRAIVLAYMAACVQHQGVKFQWCPVLQGVEGNGKTTLSLCVAHAIGMHYTHWIEAEGVLSQFNAWLAKSVFVGLEELQAGDSHLREQVIEKLKTMITGSFGVQIQLKGVDQVSMPIVANFMATTNYKTAVRKTPDNGRRFAVFYCPQQTKADIERDGLGGDYFPRLYAWLRGGGFAIVADFLHTCPIPEEFNPATTLHRAPHTSTTDAAIAESRGGIEQGIMEAVAEGRPGFMGGWVSSGALELLLEGMGNASRIPPSKRRNIMTDLGYVLHPGLHDGRVNNPVAPDGRKVQLYVLKDSPLPHMRDAADIAKAYTDAQKLATARA